MDTNSTLPPPNDDNFPAALAAARQALGISAAELARRAGISPTMIARYENVERADHHRPRPHTITLLERALRDAVADKPSTTVAPLLTDVPLDALIEEMERRGFGVTITRSAPR